MTRPATSTVAEAAASETTTLRALAKVVQQHLLLADPLSRRDLLNYAVSWPLQGIRVQVIRNVTFESVASAMQPFLAHADLHANWIYSDYDDSLSLTALDESADAVLVWLDFGRYTAGADELSAFLSERLSLLRTRTQAPLLVADAPGDVAAAKAINAALHQAASSLPGVFIYARSDVAAELGSKYRDPRLASLAGADLSGPAVLAHARDLGLSWTPALVRPPIRCIALDLDNTLYAGVLGEDGPSGLQLTPAHRVLQERLVGLWRSGAVLAIVSKNEVEDVDQLLQARPDFPLQLHMISARAVSWGSKSSGLAAVAGSLNIGIDAVLFVEDNLGEIAEVAAALPDLPVLYAADPGQCVRAMDWFPGLRRLRTGREDQLRSGDLAMNAVRRRLKAGAGDYVSVLKPKMVFSLADRQSIHRLQELSQKTNQFNLGLRRLTAAEAAGFIDAQDAAAVGGALSDALSDSGVVLSLFARKHGRTLLVEDVCISCRALGRGLEDAMILEPALALANRFGAERLAFRHQTGRRNQPARAWLAEITGHPLAVSGEVELSLERARSRLGSSAVQRLWG